LDLDLSFAIADKIDAIIKKKGMTQKEFAKKMNKTEVEVSRWLSGTHNFTLKTIAKITAVLGESIVIIP
jgi:transcriptional regulator with XRE-family HTH domain